jgi:D-tyrosyl-tRNA(Tyr) deacylase
MRAVVQRVSSASVSVGDRQVGKIDRGLVAFVGIERGDEPADTRYIAGKICEMRVFQGGAGHENHLDRSVQDVGGSVLLVSQFTLAGDCRRGRRPSFDSAEAPQVARPIFDDVVQELRSAGVPVQTGEFQAMMLVSLVNDGPVTLLLDSRRRF